MPARKKPIFPYLLLTIVLKIFSPSLDKKEDQFFALHSNLETMTECDVNWFAKLEEELPSPDQLAPLSQTLITPNLAAAFNIPNPCHPTNSHNPRPANPASGRGESTRSPKRPRIVWTLQLHSRFVDAVEKLGMKNASPRNIMERMDVDGLTRAHVASHLQKYRAFLKQNQGHANGNGHSSNSGARASQAPSRVPPVTARDLELGDGRGGKKCLTLFPSGSDQEGVQVEVNNSFRGY